MNEELKPCPFCSSKDIELWPMNGFESPCCMSCGATIAEAIMTGKDTEKQIKAWNTRDEELEAINTLLDELWDMRDYKEMLNKIRAFSKKN